MEQSYYVEKEPSLEEMPLQFSAQIQTVTGEGTMVQAHIHDYIEILYVISGAFMILLNQKPFRFSEGDMVLINSNEVHNIQAVSTGENRYYVIKFKPDMLYTTSQSLFEIKYLMPFILNESEHQKIFKKEEIESSIIPAMIEGIYREYSRQEYGFELAVRANIFNLFLYILRSWKAKDVDLNMEQVLDKEMLRRFNAVFDHINNHYHEDITAAGMAKKCHLSYSYFSRIFNKLIQKSFKDYLNYVRIAKAEKLLCTTEQTITEIAMTTGFSTSSYFIQQFKKYKGMSPRQFRASCRFDAGPDAGHDGAEPISE